MDKTPIDSRALAISTLTVTASVMLVGLILLLSAPREAQAIGMNDRSGDFVMTTMQLSSSREAIVVIDAASQRMAMYTFNPPTSTFDLLDRGSLTKLPEPGRR
ncbi:MAG: hypothetical protein KDA32_03490 [Phycisphaerales bacterium]|nr:hypothetical protein [Phycisphaerales bacterium]